MSLKNAIKILFGLKSERIKTIRIGALDELATEKSSRKKQASGILDIPLDKIDVSPEYAQAIDYLQSDCPLIFITGKAGTGKSTFIQYLRTTTKKNLAVVAPTGVAAINAHGQTIHSFFHFPPRPLNREDIKRLRNRTLYEKLDLLIVDEVSMVRADLLDAMELFLRINTGSEEPFGGVQIVFIGDLFQLPPVVARDEEARLFGGKYASRYFFSAHCLKNLHMAFVELNKVYRQESEYFINLLTAIREEESHEAAIAKINELCFGNSDHSKTAITLTCTNAVAGRINNIRLQLLPTKEHIFEGRIIDRFPVAKGKLPSPYNLHLKVGAQVMFTKNDSQKRWVNGTLGAVKDTSMDSIQLETFPGQKIYSVSRVSWESLKFTYDEIEGKVIAEKIGEYIQFPLMLAWAVTIHKAQGKTLDKVLVDLGTGAFDTGQVYVALSRCSSLEDITLKRPIRLSDVKSDPVVKRFYKTLREINNTHNPEFG